MEVLCNRRTTLLAWDVVRARLVASTGEAQGVRNRRGGRELLPPRKSPCRSFTGDGSGTGACAIFALSRVQALV
jgi:hypothetical protein